MPSSMPFARLRRLLSSIRSSNKEGKQHFVRPAVNCGYGKDEPNGVSSVQELLEFNAHHNPDHIFCTQFKKDASGKPHTLHEITFRQILKAVDRASAWLVKSGCTSGRSKQEETVAPVGILLSSDITIFIYIAALLRIGTPVLLLSARLTPEALHHLITETRPSCVLVNSQVLFSTASEAVNMLPTGVKSGSIIPTIVQAMGYEEFLDSRNPYWTRCRIPSKFSHKVRQNSKDFILHSSGTTGLPKPVFHSHQFILTAATAHRLQGYESGSGYSLSSLPLYHCFGHLPVGLSLTIGMPLVLLPASTIPTGRTLTEALRWSRIHYLFAVPSLLEEMIMLPHGEGLKALQRLQLVAVGGAPMKEAVGDQVFEAGVPLLNHWGCTELGAITPIELPDRDVDWRCLRPRTDTNICITRLNDTRFQISGCPPGWKDEFAVQDALMEDPTNKEQYRLAGRQDNLIVLSTGEKISPALIETEIGKHPQVKDVLAFGDGQPALGLIIELRTGTSRIAFLEGMKALLDRGNAFVDKHGKVDPDMVFLTSEDTKPLLRTDKGTLSRKACLATFAEEISSCYSRSNTSSPYPGEIYSLRTLDESSRRDSIRDMVKSILGFDEIEDDADFFDVGMDSSQVARLRRMLQVALNSPSASATAVELPLIEIDSEFCFRHSSISELSNAMGDLLAGRFHSSESGDNVRIDAMTGMLARYRDLTKEHLPSEGGTSLRPPQCHHTVLITGSTGSLGSFLLHRLVQDPNIAKVICLCRPPTGEGLEDRQRRLMKDRGLTMDNSLWEKVAILAADFSRPDFGLDKQEFKKLTAVTHIIHNAWPVNFNRTLSSFEHQIQTTEYLIRLARSCGSSNSPVMPPPRFVFISSIAVVGQYSSGPVPEAEMLPEHTSQMGYAESKWVAEQLILAASKPAVAGIQPPFKSSIIRIGQISGAEESGAWNQSENIPIIMKTSQKLGFLPAIEGSLSWLPVNRTADTIHELLFSKGFAQFYHIENPSRQLWGDVLQDLASIISPSNPTPVIPFAEWLEHVRERGDHDNPAFNLLGFLERDFSHIASGWLMLCTQNARDDSLTLSTSEPVQLHLLKAYMSYWAKLEDF